MMLDNLGLHFEVFNILSVILLVVGGILGYGSKFVLEAFQQTPSDRAVIVLKFIGLVLVLAGIIIIFKG